MKEIINADVLEILLRHKFSPPEWAFIPQVRNGTGYMQGLRTADAFAMGLWPSRGLYLNGFEIKINRGDWLSELKNPKKAEDMAQFCDFWWVVAPKDIIKVEEVPVLWGLMIPFGKTVKIVKQAPQANPLEINRLFLAALLRRAQEVITPDATIKIHYKQGFEEGKKSANEIFDYERKRHEELRKIIDDFEKISGVSINNWHTESIGEAVRLVLAGGHTTIQADLKNLLKQAEAIVVDIKNNLEGKALITP